MDDLTESRRGGRGPGRSGRPDPADQKQLADSPVSLARIARLFAPYRGRLGVIVALIVASSVIGLAQPFLVRNLIDEALPQQDVTLLLALVGGMIAVAVVGAVLGVLQTWLSTAVGQQVMHRLRTDLFAHLQRQSIGFFTRTRGGEVQSRLTNDINGMQGVVTSTATSVASNLTVVVGTAVAMAALSWRLALLSLIVLPPAVWLTRQVARMRHAITSQRQRALADLHVQVEESLSVSGALLTRTLGAAPAMTARFTETSEDLIGLEVRSQLAGRWRMATMTVLFAAIPGAHLPHRRAPGHVRRDDHRHPGRLHRAPGQPVPAADGPAQRGGVDHRVAGAVQPDLRVPGPPRGDRRPRRAGRPGRRPRRGAPGGRLLRVRRGVGRGAARHRPDGPGRRQPRAGRRDRVRQEHAGVPGGPPPRPHRGPGHPRRPRPAGPRPGRRRRRGRRGDPGDLPAAQQHPGQPAARPAGGDRRRDRGRLPRGADPRPGRLAARRLRHRGRRPRAPVLRR